MKNLLVILATAMIANSASAFVTQFTMVNHSNMHLNCAVAQIVKLTPNINELEVTVYHWFMIPNGQQAVFNSRTDGYYCESPDGAFKYQGNAVYFCVSRSQHVNPIYRANRADSCYQMGGQMVPFNNVSGFGAKKVLLNAP